ncbi:MAG: hypothetical protein OZSIB_0688 [Candidatus Ozemobacter sibiricus]|uniref:Uncharacterized protein n=1 Tax=Candidatus Ozemobacter sibiricus TaxID=2268124 RepID=A0A367ZTS9_9BACT|nr:MAG: hypothetical protein OZSIB_0688 [Candidatus Ozemobacter sibiricus]
MGGVIAGQAIVEPIPCFPEVLNAIEPVVAIRIGEGALENPLGG